MGAGAKIGDALHAAARGGHGSVVTDLLENGASSVAATHTEGMTPLHAAAAREGKTEMVQLLLLKGADIDAMDQHTAVSGWRSWSRDCSTTSSLGCRC